jgi:hypothetical protein
MTWSGPQPLADSWRFEPESGAYTQIYLAGGQSKYGRKGQWGC